MSREGFYLAASGRRHGRSVTQAIKEAKAVKEQRSNRGTRNSRSQGAGHRDWRARKDMFRRGVVRLGDGRGECVLAGDDGVI